MHTTSEPPTMDPDNPALRTGRTSRHTHTMPTHPDEVRAAACNRIATRFDEEAALISGTDPDIAETFTQLADSWRHSASRFRRRRRGFAQQSPASTRPRLRLIS